MNSDRLTNCAVIRDDARNRWLRFDQPVEVLRADYPGEVPGILRDIDEMTKGGLFAVGFVSYEAAPVFDDALVTRKADDEFPAAWFGLYASPKSVDLPMSRNIVTRSHCGKADVAQASCLCPANGLVLPGDTGRMPVPRASDSSLHLFPQQVPTSSDSGWSPSVQEPEYDEAIRKIRAYIAAGDTYQVNYSFRLTRAMTASPWEFFSALVAHRPPPYAAYIDTGRFAICSTSPELFFSLDGTAIKSRPMKGTAPRGMTQEEDRQQALWLQHSAKNRAENLMIVDMVRNDLGRIARPGSVRVPRLFEVEKYPSVWQMTSTVTAETDADLPGLFGALFPAASITGAPKARTMEIIRGLETRPRRIYTGAIGFAGPNRRALFNVAIRTVLIDRERGQAEYGVGGGVLWDSTPEDEWMECANKALALSRPVPDFRLLETMRWTRHDGFALLEAHLERLSASAEYFDFHVDIARMRDELETAAAAWDRSPRRVRLLVDREGRISIESSALGSQDEGRPIQVALARSAVDTTDPYLYHKTTHRGVYDRALAERPRYDDVILWNEWGEVTESCLANVVVELDGERWTPPIRCGLLAGTYRAGLMDEGKVKERVIRVEDLARCTRILLVNSVRGEQVAALTP